MTQTDTRPADSAAGAHPRLLIEDWFPAAALSVECMREENNPIAKPPTSYLHVWWARRPLAASRAAILASVLPANFPRDIFERVLGFWGRSDEIVAAQRLLDWARATSQAIPNPHGSRAFRAALREADLSTVHETTTALWGASPTVIDPMAGGGSIPLESARLGFTTLANEYNPVACTVLEATVDLPLRFGAELGAAARRWGTELRRRFNERLMRFYPKSGPIPPYCYIFARTVPCPDTG